MDDQSSAEILVERNDGWATVVLNRPQRRNALTRPLLDQLATAIDQLSADESIAAIVLRGAEGAFSSGIDLTDLQANTSPDAAVAMHTTVERAHLALFNCKCPIVVALERYSINGSTAYALAADILVAGESAFMQIGEINQGARIPMNAAWLRLKVSETVLARVALMGDRVPAAEMHRLGVVHDLVPDTQVVATAEAHAKRLAAYPAASARNIKRDITHQRQVDPEVWFAHTPSSALLTAQQVRS